MHFPELRTEFRGTQLPETVVHLSGPRSAIARPVKDFLEVTYPTADVVDCLRAVAEGRAARPLVLKGDRGRGKSHLMAVLHHAIAHPVEVEAWAAMWAKNSGITGLADLKLARGFTPITRAINDNDDGMFLWDVLFTHHKHGAIAKVQHEGRKLDSPQPSQRIYEEMFKAAPTCLILDEFQTWFEGLPDRQGERLPRAWAFNTIQLLSQIAEQHPDKLILIASVRSSNNEAFAQLQRVNPSLVDFGGPTAVEDRRRLLLHRLFSNRGVFTTSQISDQVKPYADERIRLCFGQVSGPDEQARRDEVVACWPFSPELLDLLEKQILLSQNAQETREAIKILAALCRVKKADDPLLTPADFHVDGDGDSARALLTAIAQGEQEKLGEIAAANLRKVIESGESVPNARGIISGMWVRSLGSATQVGGTRRQLQLDVSKHRAIDDNAFRAELELLVDHSVNIHTDDRTDEQKRYSIGAEENPQTKVKAWARNDREWATGGHYPDEDVGHLRRTIEDLLRPATKELTVSVIILGPQWRTNPWADIADARLHPANWDRPVAIVLPDAPEIHAGSPGAFLGVWLRDHVQRHRNWVRFILPPAGTQPSSGLYADAELRQVSRCSYLTSKRAWGSEIVFFDQHAGFDKILRDRLRLRFARVACLQRWNYERSELCAFVIDPIDQENLRAQGDVVSAAEKIATDNAFDPPSFKRMVVALAGQNKSVGDLLRNLEEPVVDGDCTPYIGAKHIQERLIALVAENVIAMRAGGTWQRAMPGEDPEEGKRRLNQSLFRSGSEQESMQLGLPSAIPTGGPMPEPERPPVVPPIGGQPPVAPPTGPVVPGPMPGPDTGPGTPIPMPPAGPRTESRRSPAASKTNLLAWIEAQQRDIPAGVPLETSLRLTGVSVVELRKLIQSLPVSAQPSVEIQWLSSGAQG